MLSCLIGILIGAGVLCLVLIPKVKRTKELDQAVIERNQAAKVELAAMEQRTEYLKTAYDEKYSEFKRVREDLEKESRNAETAAKGYYDKMMSVYKQKLDYDLADAKKAFDTALEQYKEDFLTTRAESVQDFLVEMNERKKNLEVLHKTLQDAQAKVNAAVEANKRAAEMESKEDFYKLNISEQDLDEIAELRKCAKHLRDPEPLNKVIWKVYYEKAYTDLIGRVVGSGVHCGIYKITNLNNGMCYVGQAVNIADRWKQHIKRGIGAETPTRNKLYPAMLAVGVENFSFEIIEECERTLLNDREDYWQEYFSAKEFGYSIK